MIKEGFKGIKNLRGAFKQISLIFVKKKKRKSLSTCEFYNINPGSYLLLPGRSKIVK